MNDNIREVPFEAWLRPYTPEEAVLIEGLELHDELVGLGLLDAATKVELLLEFILAVDDQRLA